MSISIKAIKLLYGVYFSVCDDTLFNLFLKTKIYKKKL